MGRLSASSKPGTERPERELPCAVSQRTRSEAATTWGQQGEPQYEDVKRALRILRR
jgi:hypothetical protein